MRKAFTLVELLIVIATIPIFMVLMSRLFGSLLTETPRIWKNVQQNSTMIHMLTQMQNDIDNATDLPVLEDGFITDSNHLLIQQKDILVAYEISEEQIVRRVLSSNDEQDNEPRIWKIPDAKITWNVLRKDNQAYALEVHNHIEYEIHGRFEEKMANTHLYFIGAL